VLAFGEANLVKGGKLNLDLFTELVSSIKKARLYPGCREEIMWSAACRMVECISLADVLL
jgi:hypothetical protein